MNSMSIFVGFLALIFGVGGYATVSNQMLDEWRSMLTPVAEYICPNHRMDISIDHVQNA